MNLTGDIKVGEVGKTISWVPALGSVSLIGGTVNLVLLYPDGKTRSVLGPFSVSSDGTTATYLTQKSDFPIGGRYWFQFTLDFPGGHLETDIIPQTIGDSL